jgi:hypothetical protein
VPAVHHLDPLVNAHFPSDNYATFLTELIVARRAVQALELRRTNCARCAAPGGQVDEGFSFDETALTSRNLAASGSVIQT